MNGASCCVHLDALNIVSVSGDGSVRSAGGVQSHCLVDFAGHAVADTGRSVADSCYSLDQSMAYLNPL